MQGVHETESLARRLGQLEVPEASYRVDLDLHDRSLTFSAEFVRLALAGMIKILVSEPNTAAKVLDVMRTRILASKGQSGMFKPVAHIRGNARIVASKPSGFTWVFADDDGHDWRGRCTVASSEEKDKFIVAMSLKRK